MQHATEKNTRKAIAITSGGLDSALAIRIIKDLGIDVLAVHFSEPICWRSEIDGAIGHVKNLCDSLSVPYRIVTIGQDFLDMLTRPKHGYGSGFNPCTDCHTLMLRKAAEIMITENASFVVTGEVVGQRPMSQTNERLRIVERDSGLAGLILRPLSAKLLEPTIPEKEEWVDRQKLFGISGRSRRWQIQMAKEYGIRDYSTPAGGCLLTDQSFSRIVRDHVSRSPLLVQDVPLLKTGRHFRMDDGTKLVLGRNREENDSIRHICHEQDTLLCPISEKGPTALLRGWKGDEATLDLGLKAVACYSDGVDPVVVQIEQSGASREATAPRVSRSEMERWHV